MKKTIAIVAVLATMLSFAVAKDYSFTFGAQGFFGEGWGKSWGKDTQDAFDMMKQAGLKVSDPFDLNMLYGGGAFINLPIAANFGVQPEVNYMVNNTGYKMEDDSSNWMSACISYNSIDIPVLFTYKALKFNFLVGPYISIPVGDFSVVSKDSSSTADDTWTGTIASKTLFGMMFGFNVAERMGGQYLILGARYMLDFSPIQMKDSTSGDVSDLYTRRALLVNAGIRFAL